LVPVKESSASWECSLSFFPPGMDICYISNLKCGVNVEVILMACIFFCFKIKLEGDYGHGK
jgi:hypothetical protein